MHFGYAGFIMNVWLKRVLFSLVVALLVAVVGLAIFLLTFNPNAYKSRLEQLVFDRYARTLTIGGDISLSLFPRIGLSVSDVSLSNHSSKDTFISVDSARFAVAIWPLLSNQLVVDHVAIAGLKAWVVRDGKGHFNFSDLLESGGPVRTSGMPTVVAAPLAAAAKAVSDDPENRSDLNIDIAGLELKDGQIHYLDQVSGLSTTLSSIEANTGRVTYDQPFDVSLKAQVAGDDPVQDAQLQAQALLRLNPGGRGYYSAQKINVQLTGRLGNLDQANATLKGNLGYKGSERRLTAGNLELALAGNIVGAHPIQDLKANLTAGQLRLDPRNLELKVAKLALRASGQDRGRNLELALDAPSLAVSPESAQADPVAATLKSSGDQTLAVSLGLEGLSGNANDWQFRKASLDGALTQGKRLVQVKLTSPLNWNTSLRKGSLTALKGDVTVRDQAQPKFINEIPMIGSVHLDLVRDALDVDLNAVMDGGQTSLKSTTTRLIQPRTQFSLNAEKIDLNHWVPKPAAAPPAKPPAEGKDESAKASGEKPAAAAPAPAAAPDVIDLSFLKGQDIQGDLRIADLRIRDLQLTQVAAPVRVVDGALTLPKVTAKLYDGSLNAQVRAAADQTVALKLGLDKVAVAPLLQAALGRNLLSGQGAAQLDLKTQGNTTDAWLRGLSGRAAWQVKDGAVQGIDASQTLSEVSAALGNVLKGRMDALASPFNKQRSTPFSSLEGRIDLKDGQGTVSKLLLASSLVRVTAGKPAQIDVPGQRVNLQLLAQVAARAPKPLAGALGSLLGATIPVLVTGDWEHPEYVVQWEAIRNQSIQQAVKSGLMELIKGKDPIEQALPSPEPEPRRPGAEAPAKSDPVERIGNALKGLLGQ
mgnify:CR=1 FL=1